MVNNKYKFIFKLANNHTYGQMGNIPPQDQELESTIFIVLAADAAAHHNTYLCRNSGGSKTIAKLT